jgi:hypothetical protein
MSEENGRLGDPDHSRKTPLTAATLTQFRSLHASLRNSPLLANEAAFIAPAALLALN